MKQYATLVIAALMITSMAILASTTTVSTPSVFGASATTVVISPTTVPGSRYVLLTLTVTNDTGENIRRILLRNTNWDNPMGGEQTIENGSWLQAPVSTGVRIADNWDNVAENLKMTTTVMAWVTENLKEAAAALKSAGTYLKQAGENLKSAGSVAGLPDNYTTLANYLTVTGRAGDDLIAAGTALSTEPFDLIAIKSALDNAGADLKTGGESIASATAGSATAFAGFHLQMSENRMENAAVNILNGQFRLASDNFRRTQGAAVDNGAAAAMEMAGENMGAYTGTGSAAVTEMGRLLENYVALNLCAVENKLRQASDNIREAGQALQNLQENYLRRALALRMTADPAATIEYVSQRAVDNIKFAADNIDNLSTTFTDNILSAGMYLRAAGQALSKETGDSTDMLWYTVADAVTANATSTAFREFGSSYWDTADNYLIKAADNLRSITAPGLNLTTAATNLTTFATNVGAATDSAAAKLDATGVATTSPGWFLWEPANGDARWEAIADNVITPGGSKTLNFLWRAPSPGAVQSYDISVWTYKVDNTQTNYQTLSITVDDKAPSVYLKVAQTGISGDNIVGKVYDNGQASIIIDTSEAVTSLGTVTIENSGSFENLLPPISFSSLTKVSDTQYKYTFAVGNWDDNVDIQVKVAAPCATDANGAENSQSATLAFLVDTRAPRFIENGMAILYNLPRKRQAGTTNYYFADNSGSQKISGRVEDNWPGTLYGATATRFGQDNSKQVALGNVPAVVKVYVGDELMTPTATDNFEKIVTLSDGLYPRLTVRAVDWVGNENSLWFDNIFIDTAQPTITFSTITRLSGEIAWTDGIITNDNTPTIKIIMTDPGYPTTGLGVAGENMAVYITENADWSPIATGDAYRLRLENKDIWDPTTGLFENQLDNAGKGLKDGTYYVWAYAGDNIRHGYEDNENKCYRFAIDTSKPTVPTPTASVNPLDGSSLASPAVQTTTSLTIRGTGMTAEAGATIKVYIKDATTGTTVTTDTTTVQTDGTWSKTIILPAAGTKYQIEVTCIDAGGNESTSPTLYGFVLADGTSPTVTISVPVASGGTYSSDQASVVVSGTIGKDAWETYNAGTMSVTATTQVGSATAGTLTINSDGTFSTSAALSEGTNTITIRAVDSATNVASATITITRTVTPWATYAIIIVIVALILAAIAIFRKR